MKSAKNINHIRHAKKHAKNINQSDTRRSGFWREISAPLFILILIPAFCLRNSRYISDQTRSWLNQIQIVEDLSGQGDFSAAFDTLSDSYQDWLTARSTTPRNYTAVVYISPRLIIIIIIIIKLTPVFWRNCPVCAANWKNWPKRNAFRLEIYYKYHLYLILYINIKYNYKIYAR